MTVTAIIAEEGRSRVRAQGVQRLGRCVARPIELVWDVRRGRKRAMVQDGECTSWETKSRLHDKRPKACGRV